MQKFLLVFTMALACAGSFGAQDFLRFLQENRWKVYPKPEGLTTEIGPYRDEHYFVKDEWGNEYTVNLFPRTYSLFLLATHELAEAIGLPRVPVYPVLVRRGVNGIPTDEDLEKGRVDSLILAPEELEYGRYKRHFGDNEYHSALLMPRIPVMRALHPPTTVVELTDTLKQILYNLALGADNLHFGVLDDQRQHYLLANGIFGKLGQKLDWKVMKDAMKDAPYRNLQALSKVDAEIVRTEIAAFLDRLEWVSENHAEKMFAGAIAAATDDEGVGHPYIRHFKSRVGLLRALTERQFRERLGGFFKGPLEKKPLPRDVLYVAPRYPIPRWVGSNPKIPVKIWERRANARNLLEAFFFGTEARREEMLRDWPQELGIDGDPIAFLMKEAHQWDGTVRLVNSKVRLTSEHSFDLDRREPQLFLNRNYPRTLVVFSPNDPESREVDRVIEEVRDQIPLIPMRLELAPGQRINRPIFDAVMARAKEERVSHIVFGEIRGLWYEDRRRLEAAGFTYDLIDHHEESDATRWHPYSWLEQFFHRLNYQPDLQQIMSGISDRSGLHAFLQINWDINAVTEYLTRFRPDLLQLRRHIEGRYDNGGQDVVLLLEQKRGATFMELSYSFNWEVYPRIANAMVTREGSILFFGNAHQAMNFYDTVKKQEPHVSVMRGGDISSTVFVVVRPRKGAEDIDRIAARLKDRIRSRQLLAGACAMEVAFPQKTAVTSNSASNQTEPSSRSFSQSSSHASNRAPSGLWSDRPRDGPLRRV